MRAYFYERCAGRPKSKDSWPTIRPVLSKKGVGGGTKNCDFPGGSGPLSPLESTIAETVVEQAG